MYNTRSKILVAILVIAIVVGLFSTVGLSAPRVITMWSFASNNADEWKARKPEIDKKFDINLNIQVVAENAFIQKLQASMMDKKDYPDIIEWRIENNQILFTDPAKSFVVPLEKYINNLTVKSSSFNVSIYILRTYYLVKESINQNITILLRYVFNYIHIRIFDVSLS